MRKVLFRVTWDVVVKALSVDDAVEVARIVASQANPATRVQQVFEVDEDGQIDGLAGYDYSTQPEKEG